MEPIQIKVSSKSEVNKVAGAITAYLDEGRKVEMHAVGAGAVNQAIKSVVVARGFIATKGINLSCIPAFTEVDVEGEARTGIKLILVTD